jgi:hypothetical protein
LKKGKKRRLRPVSDEAYGLSRQQTLGRVDGSPARPNQPAPEDSIPSRSTAHRGVAKEADAPALGAGGQIPLAAVPVRVQIPSPRLSEHTKNGYFSKHENLTFLTMAIIFDLTQIS